MSERIVVQLPRRVKRRLNQLASKSRDAALRTRIQIVLRYSEGWGAPSIAQALGCVPATAVRVVHRFLEHGEEGLRDARRDNGQLKVDADLRQALAELVRASPEAHGWPRPTWTRELLARGLHQCAGVRVSVTTVARMLKKLKARWGMARPVVRCPWSRARKQRRLREILNVVQHLPAGEVAFYEDELDVHLNPRIGRDWMLCGQQKRILTPGQNRKRYVAGALPVGGGRLLFVHSERKNTELFVALLEKLRCCHPQARRIHLVLDNYGIHTSRRARSYLEGHEGLFVLHFLPPYSPDDNPIERVWREVHANVTRNHRCGSIEELMVKLGRYLLRHAINSSRIHRSEKEVRKHVRIAA